MSERLRFNKVSKNTRPVAPKRRVFVSDLKTNLLFCLLGTLIRVSTLNVLALSHQEFIEFIDCVHIRSCRASHQLLCLGILSATTTSNCSSISVHLAELPYVD